MKKLILIITVTLFSLSTQAQELNDFKIIHYPESGFYVAQYKSGDYLSDGSHEVLYVIRWGLPNATYFDSLGEANDAVLKYIEQQSEVTIEFDCWNPLTSDTIPDGYDQGTNAIIKYENFKHHIYQP